MDRQEETVKKYLENHCSETPIFEPDGNIPPDFRISYDTAIEVRRLNRSFNVNDSTTSEEGIYILFNRMLNEVLRTFDCQFKGKSYWVFTEYIRPFNPSKLIKQEVEIRIEKFLQKKYKLPHRILINDVISLHIHDTQPTAGRTFMSIGSFNYDPYHIPQLYIENLKTCIAEKSSKIKPYKQKYREWQLILVDLLSWDLSVDDKEKIKASITHLGLFDSVTVINHELELILKI